jgi:uncharacterized protein YgbK (DUF1537 family)
MKTTIELCDEQMNVILIKALMDARDTFNECLQQYEDGKEWVAVFETDREKDIKELKKHVKACNRLLHWFGGIDG